LEIQLDADGFAVAALESSVPESSGKLVQIGGKEIALFRADGRVHAVENACPHSGGSLAEGACDNGVVACPLHGWTFDVRTGCSERPKNKSVERYETRIVDGQVLVQLAPKPGVAVGS
jgi:nitrite reductase/ring-hydroxylating ferredoxin subunit